VEPTELAVEDFAAVYEATFDAVYRYATVLAGDPTVAEDIAAEVYFRAWRSRRSYRGEGTQLSWLLSITHNTAATLLRRRARERPNQEVVDKRSGSIEGPERHVENSSDREMLLEAIRKLTPEQQQVVILRFFGDRSHREIARELGRKEDAVRALQYRALKQLRKNFQPA
jgi:RNA polymerase sigma-70 factor (ECF subfamily)